MRQTNCRWVTVRSVVRQVGRLDDTLSVTSIELPLTRDSKMSFEPVVAQYVIIIPRDIQRRYVADLMTTFEIGFYA